MILQVLLLFIHPWEEHCVLTNCGYPSKKGAQCASINMQIRSGIECTSILDRSPVGGCCTKVPLVPWGSSLTGLYTLGPPLGPPSTLAEFVLPQIIFFCDLKLDAKFHTPRTTPSGRKVCGTEKRKQIIPKIV